MQPIDPDELARLERRFGPIPRRVARLELDPRGRAHWWPRLVDDRRAEVVLILPRPERRVVLITKPLYPIGLYRLPTGGVGLDEALLDAAAREAMEETGLTVQPERVLGVVDWTLAGGVEERPFASYLCLFPVTHHPLQATDPAERISSFREEPVHVLATVAAQLKQLSPDLRAWGEHRAIPHEFAHQLLVARQ